MDKENHELITPTGQRFSVGFGSMDSEPLAKLINASPRPSDGGQEWSIAPCALHFNIMRGDKIIYEGCTSETQGNKLVEQHNASLAAAVLDREVHCTKRQAQELAAERERSKEFQKAWWEATRELAAEREKHEQAKNILFFTIGQLREQQLRK